MRACSGAVLKLWSKGHVVELFETLCSQSKFAKQDMANIRQDWEPVVLSKSKPTGASGAPAGPKGGVSKQTSAGVDIRHLEDDEGDSRMALPTVSQDLRIALAQARQAKGLSQKDLAAKLMIPAKVIQDYESGKAIPNNGLIAKFERTLGCKLPRSK
mmetsp:Transcript_31849/g.85050  ORF Transcript_31849/g.85050 Transcript_31849/m.85050 type:complete len:157 (-) Transcript_31849:33-503(-)